MTPILDVNDPWTLPADGHAIAVLVTHAQRVAVWDFGSARFSWATDHRAGISEIPPVWSSHGTWLYYATEPDALDSYKGTMYRVHADGSDRTALAAFEHLAAVSGDTRDGRSVIWSRDESGGTVEILDVATGTSRISKITEGSSPRGCSNRAFSCSPVRAAWRQAERSCCETTSP